MTSPTRWLIAAALTLIPTSGAHALCIYNGALYASTTIGQEFADSHWVVRGRVVSAVNSWENGATDEGGDPWTVYRVQVEERYKGDPPLEISVFTHRNSGGFYMDRSGEGADIGGEYLLFLRPPNEASSLQNAAREGMVVNYSCGQSKPWSEVSLASRRELMALANTI